MLFDGDSKTPADVKIEPRDLSFDLVHYLQGNWCDNDAFRTDFANALSLSFPRGEKLFVDSVRAFIPQLSNQKLIQDAKEFVQQEFMHRREHERFNRALCEARGFNLDEISSIYMNRIEKTDSLSPMLKLSATVCLEHMTAVFAHGVLTDERWLDNVEPQLAKFWTWHAMEETEHKSVAFDVFIAVGGDRRMLRRTMRYICPRFFINTFRTMRLMQKADNRAFAPLAYWYRGFKGFFARDGILHRQKSNYKEFYNTEFHPWDLDNREVLNNALVVMSSAQHS